MELPVSQSDTMNLAKLPEDTKLFELLKKCSGEHELILMDCSDGALVLECVDCPFHKVLDQREELHVRATRVQPNILP